MEDMTREFTITTIRVCIDEDAPVCSGRICGIGLEEDLPFLGCEDLLFQIREAYNQIGQPQPQLVFRSFSKDAVQYYSYNGNPVRHRTAAQIHACHGLANTYDLTMLSFKHAEWQGLWRDVEGHILAEYSTMLECASFLQHA